MMNECIPAADLFFRGALLPNGYWAWTRRKTVYGHRHVFEECFGPIPEGHEVHHTCESRSCANPEHFALKENRFDHMQEHRAKFCQRGLHRMEGGNLIRDPFPRCRSCRDQRQREYRSTEEFKTRRREQRRTHGAPLVGAQLRKALA